MKGSPTRQLAFIHFATSFFSKSWSFALACWNRRRLPGFIFRGARLALVKWPSTGSFRHVFKAHEGLSPEARRAEQ